ncbi:TRAP transporter substrate-binding protein DctP [Thalassorhabdomicrobium marinisediminis]|uniref:TRAP transporter substrate-binding protein DctP n=1 Tax=Thalassorhabdomicrobium marinisediminis TaxID=2170577 RepID=UPI002492F1C1|nr:TRAP transporter substrate-binding protein DctP [Thalassorhabdomicrobium marinisediminis]
MGRFWNTTVAALALGTTAIATTAYAEPVELSFATYIPASSNFITDSLVPWTEWVNERANGEFEIKVYAGGTLGRDPNQQGKLVKDGIADMAAIVPGRSPGEYPNFAIFELPGFARTSAEGTQAAWEMYKEGTLGDYDSLQIVSIWLGEPSIVFSTGPIQSIEDLAGQRVRVAGATQTDTLLTMDAIPQPVKSSEVAEAISRGVLDAALTDLVVADTFRIHEVTSHAYDIPMGSLPFFIAMNNDTYESLSPEGQELLAEAGDEWARMQGVFFGDQATEIRANLEADPDYTVVDATEEQIAQLRELTQPIREDVSTRVAPGLIDAYQAKLDEIAAAE